MSVLQEAASVKEHLSGDIIEPDNNTKVNGVIDRKTLKTNIELVSQYVSRMDDEKTTDENNVAKGVSTNFAVNSAIAHLNKTAINRDTKKETMLDADSGLKKDYFGNGNEEDEETMEHLELSDNDDDIYRNNSDNVSINLEKEKVGIKKCDSESNTKDNAKLVKESLEKYILNGSPLNPNKKERQTVEISDMKTGNLAEKVGTGESLEVFINSTEVKIYQKLRDMNLSITNDTHLFGTSKPVVGNALEDEAIRINITNVTSKLAEASRDKSMNDIETVKANVKVIAITDKGIESDEVKKSNHDSNSNIDSRKISEESMLISKKYDAKETVDERSNSVNNIYRCERSVDETILSFKDSPNDMLTVNESRDKTVKDTPAFKKNVEHITKCDKHVHEKTNASRAQATDTEKRFSDKLCYDKPATNESNDTTSQDKSINEKKYKNSITFYKPGNEENNDNRLGKTTMVEKLDEKCVGKNHKIADAESEECRDIVMVDDDGDDKDIMVIDEDTSRKTEENTNKINENAIGAKKSEEVNKHGLNGQSNGSEIEDAIIISKELAKKVFPTNEEINNDKNSSQTKNASEAATEYKDKKSLVALNFLNTFKTKVIDMTRADLEEFCILKIVEAVVDRSNLSDIKAKLKTVMQNVEEWSKKAMVLNKQNRDLQIVLRTVQEEQKKRAGEIITPLKITRSVGIQVLMTESKTNPGFICGRVDKRPVTDVNTAAASKSTPEKTPQNKKLKAPIPVPRLVPTLNSSPSKPATPRTSLQIQNSTITSNDTRNSKLNGVKKLRKPADKRSYSSVSIDLTDDEPPLAKRIATGKGMLPPVRLVPSQQLMAPGHRSPLLHTKINTNPRQVHIPIESPQGHIRPGQTVMFKTNQPNARPRHTGPGTVVRGAVPRNQKHPAPLPPAPPQPQPPNWKALPPAPNLKISKIDNGIVVSWKIDGHRKDRCEEIVSYQLYAYQETTAPAGTHIWNKIGDIKALPLPMACTLTQFTAGFRYYFAVRAVDSRSRVGPFSLPGNILLLSK